MKELIISGKNSVLEALANKLPITNVYVSKKENIKLFKDFNVSVELKDIDFLNQLSKENHQGFLAKLSHLNYRDLEFLIKSKPEAVLMLDKIQDPHNLGAIIRTANAAGIHDIILPKENSSDINNTVLKVSSGGFVGMNFYRVNSLSATVVKLKKNGYWAYATTLDKNSLPHNQVEYNKPSILIIGNEGNGVSKSVLSVVDQTIYIEQFGTVQSLNASVATGIILFDFINGSSRK